MPRAFTSKSVEATKADPKRRQEIPDPALSGLYLVVQPSGAKSWALRYRYSGKPKKLTLGKWPIMGLADARAAASEALDKVEHGLDPSSEKKATRAAREAAQLSERDKIKTLVAQYDLRHLATLKSGRTVRRELDRHVVAVWGDRNVYDIQRRDVIDLLDTIAESGRVVSANRVRAYLNTFFGWCIDRDIIQVSPANGVKPVAKEKSRDRVLSDDEIRWLWRACEIEGQPWGPLVQMLLLTGQRLGEVVGLTDGELQGDLWQLPSVRTKNGRPHDVPLSRSVVELLSGMSRVEGTAGLYHTTTGQTPMSGFDKGRNRIAKRMVEVAGVERNEVVEIPHWTFHDLRRTAATGMARIGIPVRITEAVLNHVSGTGGGIVAVYQRHDFADEKRRALDAWADYVDRLIDDKSDNVLRFSELTK